MKTTVPTLQSVERHVTRRDGPRRAVRELAARFAQEPELVLACLQGLEHGAIEGAARILEAARMALAQNPRYADLLYCTARAAIAAEAFETAEAALEQALAINPHYHDALILAARVALLRGQPTRAIDLLRRALTAGADYPDVHVLLGDVWRGQGEWGRARRAYARALELNGRLAAAREGLAALRSLETSGKSNELPT